MTFEVEVAGRIRTITIEPTDQPGRLRVTLDGQPVVVDATRTGEFGLSMLIEAAAETVSFARSESLEKRTGTRPDALPVPMSIDLQLTPASAHGELLANVAGRSATVAVNGRRTKPAADAGTAAHGEVSITAPMAGRVMRVLVAPGDEVAARQGIVVVEAMKMENELRAPRPGRVKEISVAPGTSVDAGRVLAVIE